MKNERLIAARKDKGWTQEDLARESGVDQSTISRTENGHTPTSEVAYKLVKVLGVSLGTVVGQPDEPTFAPPQVADTEAA